MIGVGRSRIIAGRIIIDYGYNINLFALAVSFFDVTGTNISLKNPLNSDNYIRYTSAARIRGANRFNVFCKIGILLF